MIKINVRIISELSTIKTVKNVKRKRKNEER